MKPKVKKIHDMEEVRDYRELIKKTVSNYPENIAYKFKKKQNEENPEYVNITYKQFQEDIMELSTGLLKLGLENKKIAVIGNNRYEWCVSYLAITTGNMIVVPLDKALPKNEMEALIIRSGAEAVICDDKYVQDIMKIREKEPNILKYLITMDEIKYDNIINYLDIIKQGKEELDNGNTQYKDIIIDAEKMSIMLFTSGTTNLPKAVMLSQHNICTNIQAIASYVKMYPTDTLLSFLPIHHTFECTITFLYGLYFGVTVAFCDGLKYIAKNLKEYKVTVFVAVPLVLETMYKKILKAVDDSGKTKLIQMMTKVSDTLLKCKIDVRRMLFKPVLNQFDEDLRVVFYGAAPMDVDTIKGYNNLGVKLLQGYGLTESSPVIACETDRDQKPGSVGYPLYNIEVKIENPDESGVGEITAKGPNIMMGYYENEEATKKVLKDGWFSTGDYGYLDKDGFLYVTGRKSDLIVLKNGKNVYPQEIEFLISKLPYTQESIVYARNKDLRDTTICAKVVYNEEFMKEKYTDKTKEDYQEIIWNDIKEINKTLPDYKHIKEVVITTEELSKTTTQKVKRFEEMKKVEV